MNFGTMTNDELKAELIRNRQKGRDNPERAEDCLKHSQLIGEEVDKRVASVLERLRR